MKKITAQNRAEMLLEAPLGPVITRLAVPTIISMLITAIYNMADTYFVSQIDTEATAAVGVVFSAMAALTVAGSVEMPPATRFSRIVATLAMPCRPREGMPV